MKRNNIRKQYGKFLAHEQLLLVMSAPFVLLVSSLNMNWGGGKDPTMLPYSFLLNY